MPHELPAWARRFSLEGRKALITGASKGIGAEIARVFADAGADIVATGRDGEGLASLAATVRSAGRACLTVAADLADPEAPARIAATATAAWGTIDILVNSAGVAHVRPAEALTLADWEATMAVNLRAPFLLSQALAPGMIAQRWGKIINISSQTGVVALQDHAAYAASKGGLNALTLSLAAEWARHGVQVNAICPTVILTPMGAQVWGDPARGDPMRKSIPAGRFGLPVEVADMALFLASPASGLVNGAVMMLDGGYTAV